MPTFDVNIPSQTLQQVVTEDRKISSIIFAESPDGNKLFAVSNDDAQLAATDGATKVTSVIVSPDDIQINVTAGASTSSLHINPSDINFTTDSLTLNGDEIATENYVASAVAGLLDYRGVYDASVNAYPSSGGSGSAGAIVKSDFWIISVAGTLPTGLIVEAGDMVIAKVDTPGNTQANWNIIQYNIGYTPENAANKVSNITASATQYPNNNAVIAYVINALLTGFSSTTGTVSAADSILQAINKLAGNQLSLASGIVSFPRRSNTWYSAAINAFTAGTVSYTRDVIRLSPFLVSENTTFTDVGMEITTIGSAGSVVRIGIYNSVLNFPSANILNAGTIAGDVLLAQTILLATPITLTPGVYWLAFVHNSTTAITFRSIPFASMSIPAILGASAAFGSGNTYNMLTMNHTYDGTFPTISGATITGLNTAWIGIKTQ